MTSLNRHVRSLVRATRPRMITPGAVHFLIVAIYGRFL